MGYASILQDTVPETNCLDNSVELKWLTGNRGIAFPVLFNRQREQRPFREYSKQSSYNCNLCNKTRETYSSVVNGMVWRPANWPIKARHAICFPKEHRASILPQDINNLGDFVDKAGDVVVCINMYGSAASIPEHFHIQMHDYSLPGIENSLSLPISFPILLCNPEQIASNNIFLLSRFPSYPAFVLLLEGPWHLLGQWLITYMVASNFRPHNLAIAPGGKLLIIPRCLEKAHSQENRYGASEMLGLIAPVTRYAYDQLKDGDMIEEALGVCGVKDTKIRLAIEEHANWSINHIQKIDRSPSGYSYAAST